MKSLLATPIRAGLLAVTLALVVAGCCFAQHPSAYRSIHALAKSGDAAGVAEDLAQHPHDLNLPDDAGLTPLHLAAAQCHTNVVALLLDKGADVNRKANGGATPLHLAAQEGCVGAVSMLLAKGATINARDGQDRTPLSRAEQWHQEAVAALLRAHGGTE